jgi:AraC-like DNA-binding protein
MESGGSASDFASIWDIATPSGPARQRGVNMAGFRSRAASSVDIRIVPYPAVTVFVNFGEEIAVDYGRGRQHTGSVVVGLAPGFVRGRGQGIECLQVRLSPAVARAVLGAPGLLGETVVALDDLWGSDATRIVEQLRDAPSWDERFAIAEGALARRLEACRGVDPEVSFAWNRMVTSGGRLRVERLASEVGWSRKRLWSQFRSQVGITPKRAAELVRFDRAAHRLAAGHSIAQVAFEGGYVDQSHLHREAVAFAGVTPTAVAAAPWLSVDDVAWPRSRPHRQ